MSNGKDKPTGDDDAYYQVPSFIKEYYFTGKVFPQPGDQNTVGPPSSYCLSNSCLTHPFDANCYPEMPPPGIPFCANWSWPNSSGFGSSGSGCCGMGGGNFRQF